jgi:predicted transcriptional regulator
MEGLRTGALLHLAEKKEATIYSLSKYLNCSTSTASEILESFRRNGLVVRGETAEKKLKLGGAVSSSKSAKPYVLADKGKRLLKFMKYLGDHDLLSTDKEFDMPREEDPSFIEELRKAGFSSHDFEDMLGCGLVDEEKVEREPGHKYRPGLSTPDQINTSLLSTRLVSVKYRYRTR